MTEDQVRLHAYVHKLADYLGGRMEVDPQAILGTSRNNLRVSHARMLIMYALRQQGWGVVEIAKMLHRDSSTVSTVAYRVPRLLATDSEMREALQALPAPTQRLFTTPDLLELYQRLSMHLAQADELRGQIETVLHQRDIPERVRRVS